MSDQRYNMRGVSASKEDVHNAIKNVDKGIFPGAFCKIIPDILGGDKEYCNIMHADGAGTKSSLAYAYWRETGDMSVWKGIAQDALIMNIDDLLCVGATDGILLSSTIGRNKNLIPGEVISAIINGTEELLAELRALGVGIWSTGGETADVGDLVRTIIVDSTVTCRMRRDRVIDNSNIKAGDVIVGLSSYGKATYEKEYNGGMGSNGLTSARHDVFAKYIAEKYPETFDAAIPYELVYSGSRHLTDAVDGIDLDFGITTTDMRESDLNRAMMRTAQKTIVLADSSKFRRRGFSKIADIEDIDVIITDSNIPDKIAQAIEDRGIEIKVVNVSDKHLSFGGITVPNKETVNP